LRKVPSGDAWVKTSWNLDGHYVGLSISDFDLPLAKPVPRSKTLEQIKAEFPHTCSDCLISVKDMPSITPSMMAHFGKEPPTLNKKNMTIDGYIFDASWFVNL
jgi:hypothetical protein